MKPEIQEIEAIYAANPQHKCPSCGEKFNRHEDDPAVAEVIR